jgi:PAS domain S-box-containing protein
MKVYPNVTGLVFGLRAMKNANINSSNDPSEGLKEKDKFRVMIESAPVGIGEISLEPPRFNWVNEATCKILEYKEEELLTMNPFDLIVEESKPVFRERIKKILVGEKVKESVNYRLKTKNGRFLWANLNINYLHKNGKLVGGLIFAQDITPQKTFQEALEKSLERERQRSEELEKLMDTIPAMVFVSYDPQCKVITGNQAAMLFNEAIAKENISAGSAYGEVQDSNRRFYRNGKPLKPEELPMQKAARTNREVRDSEVHIVLPSGKKRTVLGNASPLLDSEGKVRGCLGAFIDITERKRMERAIRGYSQDLEVLVKAEAEKRLKSERLATIGQTASMVGHDIRNPLQAIMGDLYLAFDDLNSFADCEEKGSLKESLVAIQKNVDYINKIVLDLQDFVRPLKPTISEVDLEGLIEEVLFKADLPENVKASCQVEADVKVLMSDAALLERVLGNLISNAVQAMPKGGELSVHAFRDVGDMVIAVQDTGVGVPEGLKGKLFTPLFTTKSKGQGFGLAVVKRLVESLGGMVAFESEKGKGTKFTVRLPVAKK